MAPLQRGHKQKGNTVPTTDTKDTATKAATLVRRLTDFNGDAALYQLSDTQEYVAVSAVVAYSGPETLIFPSDATGEVVTWNEIGGGRGYLDHARALSDIGYEVSA